MTQLLSDSSDMYNTLPDTALFSHIRNAGDRHAEERAAIYQAITSIVSTNRPVSNKAIMLWLIKALETTQDVVMCDIYRHALEIVVGYTIDDI